jgi:hypothetical protein
MKRKYCIVRLFVLTDTLKWKLKYEILNECSTVRSSVCRSPFWSISSSCLTPNPWSFGLPIVRFGLIENGPSLARDPNLHRLAECMPKFLSLLQNMSPSSSCGSVGLRCAFLTGCETPSSQCGMARELVAQLFLLWWRLVFIHSDFNLSSFGCSDKWNVLIVLAADIWTDIWLIWSSGWSSITGVSWSCSRSRCYLFSMMEWGQCGVNPLSEGVVSSGLFPIARCLVGAVRVSFVPLRLRGSNFFLYR